MEKKTYQVEGIFKGGPYSHVVEAGGWLYVSGTVPIDAQKGEFITGDVQSATALVLETIGSLLEAAGSGLDKVVKINIYLTDMNHYGDVNEVYEKYFPENQPARTCLGVKEIPGNLPVEMEAVAIK